MKTKLFLLSAFCFLLCFATGCRSTSDVAAYKILTGTQITVEQALGLWDSYIVAQQAQGRPVPLRLEVQVKHAYERYQSAALVMADAGQYWTYTRVGKLPDEAAAQSNYDAAVTRTGQAKADLFALLETFGVALIPSTLNPQPSTP